MLDQQSSWQGILQQIHSEDWNHFEASYRSMKGGGSHEVEYRIYHKDGEIRHIKEVAIVVRGTEDGRGDMVGLIQDVTEHAKMRKHVEESAAKLRLAARTAKLGYWRFDEVAHEYLDISDEYAEIYGYSVQDFLHRYRHLDDDMTLVHDDDREGLYEAYEVGEGKLDYVYRMRHKDGHWIYVREISIDINDEAGNYIESMGTLQDISELREAQQKAEQANQAKSDFLSRMSHELRTPLNAILGFSQLFEFDQNLDQQRRSNAHAIRQAGQHLLKLIDEILDLSRIESGAAELSLEAVSLQPAISDSLAWVEEMARSRGVSIDFAPEVFPDVMVAADAIRLKQIFLNLLSNAVKYNRENGDIRIGGIVNGSGRVSVSITDSGPGISAHRLGELFKPFNRLGAEFSNVEGTGIGLVITRQLVEQMRGEITVVSQPGEGSTFTVQLNVIEPVRIENSNPSIEFEDRTVVAADSVLTAPPILVAEDNLINQELVATQLKILGYSADFATSGSEALTLWENGSYHLLMTDIRMPEMDGYELIEQIRALDSKRSGKPIIAVTANAMKSDIDRCLDMGADAVLCKPVELEDLKQALAKWLA